MAPAVTLQLSFETYIYFKLLHFFWKAAQLHLKNPCPPDVVHLRASQSETCLSLLMSMSFSNCWGQRVKSARVYAYLLDRMPCQLWQWCRGRFRSCRWWLLDVARVHFPLSTIGTGKATMSPMLPACSSKTILSAWSVRHSLALFLSLRMLRRRSPSGEGLSGSGREAGSWSWDRGGDTSFGGTLRALSRSSSDCRVYCRRYQKLTKVGFWLFTALYNFRLLSKPVQALSVKWTTKFQSLREMPRDFSHFVKWLSELVISCNAWFRYMPVTYTHICTYSQQYRDFVLHFVVKGVVI